MIKNKLIAVKPETKNQLDELKLCEDETYDSLLKRLAKSEISGGENENYPN